MQSACLTTNTTTSVVFDLGRSVRDWIAKQVTANLKAYAWQPATSEGGGEVESREILLSGVWLYTGFL